MQLPHVSSGPILVKGTGFKNTGIAALCALVLAGCSGGGGSGSGLGTLFGGNEPAQPQTEAELAAQTQIDAQAAAADAASGGSGRSTIWDLFRNADDPNTTIEVNKYIWVAALDVLDFLPIESVDPFTGVIVTGYGTPPGGGQAYRATIYVQDPALDARSLKLSLQTRSGPVDPETLRAVEDAILTRARELRIADSNL
jgi:Domain of unknown function (DUF3576)